MEHPLLAFGSGKGVDVQQHIPFGRPAPVAVPGRPAPQALGVRSVAPEVVVPVAVLAHHGDLVRGVQHLQDAAFEPGVVGILEQVLGAGILFTDPGQRFLAVDLLEPDILVGRFGRFPTRRKGRRTRAGDQLLWWSWPHTKQHRRAASKSHADTLDGVGISQSIRTALIGAGPRGTSVLERLLANWRLRNPSASGPGGARASTLTWWTPTLPGRATCGSPASRGCT